MTPPTDPLETLGRRSALAVADRHGAQDHEAEVAAVARRAGRPRRHRIAALAVVVLAAVPLAVSQLRPSPDEIHFAPAPEPAQWVEVGREVFNGRADGEISGVAVAGETIVAVGLEPNPEIGSPVRPAAWTSTDGRTWEHRFVPDGGSRYQAAGLVIQDLAAASVDGSAVLVAVGYANDEPRTEPVAWLSYDNGTTWELRRVAGTGQMLSVTATPSGFVAAGSLRGRPAAWTSFNGEAWVEAEVRAPQRDFPGALTQVAASGDRLVAVGHDGHWEGNEGLWVSDGGATWEGTGVPEPMDTWVDLSSVAPLGDGGFIAVGTMEASGEGSSDAAVWESADGAVWERALPPAPLGTPGDQTLESALTQPGERLVVGSDRDRARIWSWAGDDWDSVFTDEATPDGGRSAADRIFATPAGLVLTGTATTEGGPQEARVWLRPAPQGDAGVPAAVEIIDQPIGTFGGATPLGPVTAEGVTITAEGFVSGVITATDAASDEELWTYDVYENAFLGPVSGSTLLAAAHYGQVVALDVETGAERWSLSLDVTERAGPPTILDGVVYLPSSYPSEGDTAAPRLRAVDLATGGVLWTRTLESGTDLQWAPPVVADDLVLVADTLSHPRSAPTSWLHAIDRTTGERMWRFDLETRRQAFNDHPPLVRDGRVFVSGFKGPLFAIDLESGEQVWRRPADEAPRTVRIDGDALIVELDGRERRVDVEDGALID